MIVMTIICAVTFLIYFAVKLKTGFHMLQQESYFNSHYLEWTVKNLSKNVSVCDLMPAIVFLCALALTKSSFVSAIIYSVINIFCAWFCISRKPAAKKPLVVTARVKRLIATASILILAIIAVLGLVYKTNIYPLLVIFAFLNLLSFLYVALVNIINRPMEIYINHWFVNDAKKKISGMSNLKVIGITGSYGKTSSKFILTAILSEKYHTLCTPESYNTTMGVVRTIREKLTPSYEIFVCEMGAKYVGDIKEICDIVHPHFGIITSIGPQHLETFGTVDNIIKTKLELADAVENKGNLVLNGGSQLIAENAALGAVYYSCDKTDKSVFWTEDVSYGPDGAKFTLCGKDISPVKLETKLLGKHNIENIVGAAAMAIRLGVSEKDIAFAIKKLKPVEHRLEMKKNGNLTIIDDAFNSNTAGAKSALEVLSSFSDGRMLITPGMVELGDKEYEYNFEFGRQAASSCDYIILVGEKQTLPIKKGLEDKKFDENKLYVAKDLNDALAKMREITVAGKWTVLLENDLPDLYL